MDMKSQRVTQLIPKSGNLKSKTYNLDEEELIYRGNTQNKTYDSQRKQN